MEPGAVRLTRSAATPCRQVLIKLRHPLDAQQEIKLSRLVGRRVCQSHFLWRRRRRHRHSSSEISPFVFLTRQGARQGPAGAPRGVWMASWREGQVQRGRVRLGGLCCLFSEVGLETQPV